MRLLERNGASEIRLTKFFVDDAPGYALLSHTCGTEEEKVIFKDLMDGTGKNELGYDKIRFCEIKPGATKAINSMFRWHRDATKCYAYLADVSTPTFDVDDKSSQPPWESAFWKSRWFTCGWTLQELIAPHRGFRKAE
ncbi:hypothetical protein DL769_005154 [Monosporascus sp. CRB-8-3]|nr:hypothetical protein DL769_005154 [Monosporascus sp. CRB-8-3]